MSAARQAGEGTHLHALPRTDRIPATDPALNRAIAAYYDGMAPYYRHFYCREGLHYGLWDAHTTSLRQALLRHKHAMFHRLGNVGPDSHILDAGCGAGRTSVLFSQLGQCRVTGITLSPVQLQAARRHAVASAATRTRFLLRDFCNCGLPDAAFSHAIASESSCYAPDKAAWLAEMHRVLAPGGRLVIADYYLACRAADLTPRQRRLHAVFCRGFLVPALPWLEDMRTWIVRSGFRLQDDEDITAAVAPTADRIRLLGLLSLPFGRLLQALHLAPPGLVPHLLTCVEQPAAVRELGSYRLLTLEKPQTPASRKPRA
jgi:tocopherol O-methyltransferase